MNEIGLMVLSARADNWCNGRSAHRFLGLGLTPASCRFDNWIGKSCEGKEVAGRPRNFDESEALRAAMHVFWRRGFEAASCEELLEAMGINCGSMYSTFGDKRALFEKAFELYQQEVFAEAMKILNGNRSPLENVRSLVKCWEKAMTGDCKGCLVSQTLIELGNTEDPLALHAKQLLAQVQATFEKQLRAAKRAGELDSSANAKDLAAMLVNTVQGLNVMARAGVGKEVYRGVIRSTLSLLT